MRLMFLLLILVGCSSHLTRKSFTNNFPEGNYLVSGCSIYSLKGEIKRSYPGQQCLFLPDGTYLSYDSNKLELTKYSSDLKNLWSKKIHVHHHSMNLTEDGKLYFLSSSFHPYRDLPKVRFDKIILMNNNSGEVLSSFSVFDHQKDFNKFYPFMVYKTNWEPVFAGLYEVSHMAALYELKEPLMAKGKVIAPKGSFIATSNTSGAGVYIIAADLKSVIASWRVANSVYHDAQPLSSHEIIYLKNTKFMNSITKDEEAQLVVYDLSQERITKEYDGGFLALLSGGLQVLGDDLILVSDSGSSYGTKTENFTGDGLGMFRSVEHKKKKARAILYSLKHGVQDEIHFDFANQHFRILDLSKFLKNNSGI